MTDTPDQNAQQPVTDPRSVAAQLEAARSELAEMTDKYKRSVADMDNFRKLQERRSLDRTRQEKKSLLLRIIEVVDDLDRALSFQEVADRETLLQSLKHTYAQLGAMLQREGVTTFTTEGESFDPRLHEAVESVDNSGLPEGHVAQEVQRGYRFGDDLLRPARVHVSSGNDAE